MKSPLATSLLRSRTLSVEAKAMIGYDPEAIAHRFDIKKYKGATPCTSSKNPYVFLDEVSHPLGFLDEVS